MVQSAVRRRGSDRFPEDQVVEARNAAVLALWAFDAAEEALQWPVDELAIEIAARPDYAAKIREIFKLMLAVHASEEVRARVAEDALAHVRAALVEGGVDVSARQLESPIEFGVLPRCLGARGLDQKC